VRALELAVAALFVLGGLRSLWIWARRPFEGTDVADHVLYALYLTARVGLWFAFAGFFLIYASVDARGVPALDELEPYRWYLVVPLGLAALQLLAGWFLGHREPGRRHDAEPPGSGSPKP
jgi:hypothetical protein